MQTSRNGVAYAEEAHRLKELDYAQEYGWDDEPKKGKKTMADKGDFARAVNGALQIVAADKELVSSGSPKEIAQAVGILTNEIYSTQLELLEELGIGDDSRGNDGRPAPVKKKLYASSNGSSGAKSSGSLVTSEKQENFFRKLIRSIESEGDEPKYSLDDLMNNAPSYDKRNEWVDELKVQAGWD